MRREGYWENGRWRGGELNELFPLPPDVLERPREGRLHLSRRDVRPRRGTGRHRRVRVSRPDRRAPGQVRVWRYPKRPCVRGGSRRDEKGRRRHPSDRGAHRRNPALRARRQRQSDGCVDARTHRSRRWARASPEPTCISAELATASFSSLPDRMDDPDARSRFRSAGDCSTEVRLSSWAREYERHAARCALVLTSARRVLSANSPTGARQTALIRVLAPRARGGPVRGHPLAAGFARQYKCRLRLRPLDGQSMKLLSPVRSQQHRQNGSSSA